MKNPLQSPETVRSGRHANFFILENAFIDDWAGVLGPISIAVYCCLWRHADKVDSTFIGTPKLAEKLKLSPRAMQRAIKTLAAHKLIRIVRTARPVRRTVFHMLPVPSPAKCPSPMPLFDLVPDPASSTDSQSGANRRRKAGDCTVARVGGLATVQSRAGDCTVVSLLMEQDPFNKRGEKQKPPGSIDLENRTATPPEDPYQLALGMMEELGFPGGPTDLAVWSKRIKFEARDAGVSNAAACAEILTYAKAAKERAEFTTPTFWMKDYDRRAEKKKNAAVTVPPEPASYEIRRELEQRRAQAGQARVQ
jgi:hypothetical protein